MSPFGNPARKDGLVLRHWKKKEHNSSNFPATPAESNAASEVEQDDKIQKSDPEYFFARYNVKLDRPEYTDQEYESHLKSIEWDRQETDYLVETVMDYDLRWPLIFDRYEYQPAEISSTAEDSMAVTMQPKQRSMEDLKTRYYDVAAKTMVLHQPLSSMSNEEFELHEKMTKYNPVVETTRKRLAEVLLSRSKEDVEEEKILLAELQRITINQERFLQERKELYARLEAPISTSSTSMYHSSEELLQLMKNLLNADKNKKSRSLTDGTPATNSNPNVSGQGERNQRHSTGGPDKRQSISGSSGQRQLSAREEAKFGVSHHDKLTTGVQFRHEKITKLSQAKSNVQAAIISAALTELNIPPRLVMPTTKVVNEYERLIQNIHILLDVRKVSEKIEAEIKILRAQKEDLERKKSSAVGIVESTHVEKTKANELDEEAAEEDENEDENEDDEDEGKEDKDDDKDEDEKEDEYNKDEDEDEEEEAPDDAPHQPPKRENPPFPTRQRRP